MVTTLDQHEHHSSGGEQLVDASTINTSAASRTTPWPQSPGPTTSTTSTTATATAALHNSTMDDRFSSIQSPSPSQGDTLRSLLEAEKTNGLKVGMRCASESSAVLGSQLYMGTIRYIGPIKVPSKPETGCVSRDGGSSADVGGVGGVGGGTGTGTGTGSCDNGNAQDDSDDELPELLRPSRLLSRLRVSGFDESGEPIFMGPDEELEGVEKDVEVMWVGIEFDDPVGKNNGSLNGKSYFDCEPLHGLFARAERALVLHQPIPTTANAMITTTPPHHRRHSSNPTPARANVYEVIILSLTPLSRIAPGLYLGNSTAAEDTRLLQSLGITHVLNVTEELPMVEWAPSMRITLADMAHANLLDTFEDALGFIDLALGDQRDVKAFTNARSSVLPLSRNPQSSAPPPLPPSSSPPPRGILVHCLMGRSRSASIIIAYIMRKYKLNYRAAHTYVHSKRPIIWPNLGFVNQLNLWGEWGCKVDRESKEYRNIREGGLDTYGKPRILVELNALATATREGTTKGVS